jgi:TPR repeat protein
MRKLIFLFCVLLWSGLATAGYDEAMTEYNKGNFKAAVKEFKQLAAQGDAEAQTMIGLMYSNGQGLPKDYKQAKLWYEKSAAQGYPGALVNLGWLYDEGKGVAAGLCAGSDVVSQSGGMGTCQSAIQSWNNV